MPFISHPDGRPFTGAEFQIVIRNATACPFCNVVAGAQCIYPDGYPRDSNHEERVTAVTGQTKAQKARRYGTSARYHARGKRKTPSRGWV